MAPIKSFDRKGLLFVALFVVLIMVVAILFLKPESISQESPSNDITSAYPPSVLGAPLNRATAEFHCSLVLTSNYQDAPSDKQAALKNSYEACVNAALAPTPTQDLHPKTPTPVPTAKQPIWAIRLAGAGFLAIEGGEDPFQHQYAMNTSWRIMKDGNPINGNPSIIVYAGSKTGNGAIPLEKPWPGLVIVDDYTSSGEGGFYWVPVKEAGPVRIVDAEGMQVILQAENGQIFMFDTISRQFTITREGPYKRPAGSGFLVEDKPTLITDNGYVWENYWYEDKDGQRVMFLAGSEQVGESGKAVLMIVTISPTDQVILSKEVYYLPFPYDKYFYTRIFDVEGKQLKLMISNEIILFDLNTRDFILN